MNESDTSLTVPRERAQYEPPAIEEDLEFETTALALCGKTTPSPQCTTGGVNQS